MWLCRRPWTADSCYSSLVFPSCRRSTTAGGRLSTAKTRCGTWPKWWAFFIIIILHRSSVSDCGGWHLFETVWDDGCQQLDLSGFSHVMRARMDFCCLDVLAVTVSSPGCSLLQIRGMNIDEAIAQLEFNDKKGAKIMKEVWSHTSGTTYIYYLWSSSMLTSSQLAK